MHNLQAANVGRRNVLQLFDTALRYDVVSIDDQLGLLELHVFDLVKGLHEGFELEAEIAMVESVVDECDVLLVQMRLERFYEAVDVEVGVDPDVELNLFIILSRNTDDGTQEKTVEKIELHDAKIDA